MQPYPNPNYFMQYQQPQYQQPNPYMQRMEQLQQFQQSLQSQNQSPALNTLSTIGKYVESIDIVKATDLRKLNIIAKLARLWTKQSTERITTTRAHMIRSAEGTEDSAETAEEDT